MNGKSVLDYVILFLVVPIFLAFTIMLLTSAIYTTSTGETFNYSFFKLLLVFLGFLVLSIVIHYVSSLYLETYLRLQIFSKVIFPLFSGAFGMFLAVKIELHRMGSSALPADIKASLSLTDALIFGLILMIPTFLVCLTIDWGGRKIWSSADRDG